MPRTLATCAVCLAVLALPAVGCRAEIINLHERVQIDGDRILLGQLADIDAVGERAEALATVSVGPAPLPGRERTLTVGYLKLRLRRCGIDCGALTFTGAEQVTVAGPPAATVAFAPAAGDPSAADAANVPGAPAPIVVPRGTRVRLAVECGAVRVLADATTQEDAAVGALVRLRVEQTRETVSAQLLSPTQALITRE